jgi:hypothetical protein
VSQRERDRGEETGVERYRRRYILETDGKTGQRGTDREEETERSYGEE